MIAIKIEKEYLRCGIADAAFSSLNLMISVRLCTFGSLNPAQNS